MSTPNAEKLAIAQARYGGKTIVFMLMRAGFSLDPDAHEFVSDVIASEVVDAGGATAYQRYAATSVVFAQDDANDRATLSCDPPGPWPALLATTAVRGVLWYVEGAGGDSTHAIGDFLDFGFDFQTSGGPLAPPLGAGGLLIVRAA